MGTLHKPFPNNRPLAVKSASPAADRLIAQVNRTANSIRRNELTVKHARLNIVELESQRDALIAALDQLGIQTVTDPVTGLMTENIGDARDHVFNTTTSVLS